MQVRGLFSFYFDSFWTATKVSWKWAAGIATGLGVLVPLLRLLIKPKPEQEAVMTSLIWQIPVAIFVIFLYIVVFIYTPYWKYQKLKNEAEDREEEFNAKIEEKEQESQRAKDQLEIEKSELRTRLEAEKAELQSQFNEQLKALQSQISDLTKYQLKFEIGEIEASLKPEECEEGLEAHEMRLRVPIRFENTTTQPVRVRNVSIFLYEKRAAGKEYRVAQGFTQTVMITRAKGWEAWQGLMLSNGEEPSCVFHFSFFLPPGAEANLTPNHFLRITMDATNQPPYSQDAETDWDEMRERVD